MVEKQLVSLVIPAFNHEKYIEDIIQSILGQTYCNLEVLITDDCSVDNTYENICKWEKKLQERCKNVQIIRNEQNLGITRTLNNMLKKCRGEYIKVIASDDFLMPDAILKLADYLDTHPKCGLVFANGFIGDENIHYPLKNTKFLRKYYQEKPEIGDNIVEKMYCKYFLFSPSVMYTRKAYREIGEYDENIWAEDWDYYLRLAEKLPIGYLDDSVVMYRMTKTSASHSSKLECRIGMRKSEIFVLYKHRDYVDYGLSRRMLYEKCNEVFKEAFDMRSKIYMKEIYSTMKRCSVKRNMRNKLLSLLYSSHLVDFLFS